MRIKFNQQYKQKGISLIELVIFIVIMSVALTSITLIYINTTRYSADPMVRIRSIELAQSTLEEILLKAYDDSTPIGGGCVRFPTQGNTLCIPPVFASQPSAFNETILTSEEGNNRALFDDVDDYNNQLYCGDNVVPANTACPVLACQDMQDESGNDISAEYSGFSVCIQLSFAGNELNAVAPGTGTNVEANDAKRIDVTVTDPLNSRIGLSAYRLNF